MNCNQAHLAERMGPIKPPKGSQRLFDLIDVPEPSHRPAFYYALQDTLVCADAERAREIAYGEGPDKKRWRVVTTDGVVINASGTMEGGGSETESGAHPWMPIIGGQV